MKKLASTITAGFLVAILAVGLAATGAAEDREEDTDVTVDVDTVAQVDVRPSSLDYTADDGLEPGENRAESDEGFEHVDISNIGSVDITEITAEATMPEGQVFGSDDFDHNTGNFVTLSTATAAENEDNDEIDIGLASGSESENPHYLNRVEYNEENPPEYITVEEDDSVGEPEFDPSEVNVGRFRVGAVEYFYVAYFNDGATDGDEFVLRIGDAPHTSTQLGTVDFSNDGDQYTEYEQPDVEATPGDGLDGFYGQIRSHEFVVFDPSEGDNDDNYEGQALVDDGSEDTDGTDDLEGDYVREYNLYTHFEDSSQEENHIQRTRFNTQVFDPLEGPEDGDRSDQTTDGAQTPLIDGTGSDALNPGQNVPINFGVEVPLGTDADSVDSGTVSFIVTDTEE